MKDDIWNDPMVKAALKEGRQTWDIAVLPCPTCGRLGYYSEGSHFSCHYCEKTWYCCSENEDAPEGVRSMSLDDMISLADTVSVDDSAQ